MRKRRHLFLFGFSLLEVIVATGILVVIASGFTRLALSSFGLDRRAWEDTAAAHYAEEGLEASRSIAARNFSEITLGSHGLNSATGVYAFAGTSNTFGLYTRVVEVTGVQRNSSDTIVQSGGTDDPDTRLVTSTVTWNPVQGGTHTVKLTTYLTRWKLRRWMSDLSAVLHDESRNSTQINAAGDGGIDLLTAASLETLTMKPTLSQDFSGTQDVNEVAVDPIRDRLYLAMTNSAGSDPEFLSLDISDISRGNITQVGALDLGDGSRGFAVGRDYAYVLTDDVAKEVRVVRLRDFSIVATWDIPGQANADPNDIVLDETAKRLYVGRKHGGDDKEFYVLNTENPEGPIVIVNQASISADVNGIALRGNFAYLATEKNSSELVTVNLTTMDSVSCDLLGTQDVVKIHISGDRLFIGRSGGPEAEFAEYAIDPNNPGACPAAVANHSTDFGADDVFSMTVLPSEGYAIFAMNADNKEIRLVKLSNFQEAASRDLTGDKCDAVAFSGAYLYAGCRDDTATMQVIEGTAGRAYRGTATSLPFDSGAEGTAWRKVRWTAGGGPGSISLRLRTADTSDHLTQAQWVGPDGTNALSYSNSDGTTIVTDPLANGKRFIQWKATLSGNGTTPILEDVTLTYP